MKPITAASFILLSAALFLQQGRGDGPLVRRLGTSCAGLVAALSALTIMQYATGVDLGIDDILFPASVRAEASAHPGRMALVTALGLASLAAGLLLRPARWRLSTALSDILALFAVLLGGIASLGYLYDIFEPGGPRTVAALASVALHTAVLMLILGSAIPCSRPERGVMAILISDGFGGLMARRTLPVALLLPIAIGWLRLQGQEAGWYGTGFGLSLFASTNIAVFVLVIWWNAARLNRIDEERHQAQEELQASEERLRLAVTGAGVGTWHWDITADRHIWSAEFRAMYGLPASLPASHAAALDAIHPADRGTVDATLKRALEEHSEFGCEYRVVWPDGSERWIAARGRVYGGTSSQPTRLEGVALDVTQRKRLTESLRESELRLSNLVGAAMDAILTLDGNQNIIQFNRAAERLFGWRAEDLVGGPVDRLLPAQHRHVHHRHVQAFGDSGGATRRMAATRRIRAVRADGEEFPVEASISQVEVSGSRYYTVILRDITERELAQDALSEANSQLERKVAERTAELQAAMEAARSADRQKTRFLGLISHELRTPLNAIIGFTGTLLMKLKGPLNAHQEKQLRTIQGSARHLLSLINDLLAVVKIESGKIDLAPEDVVCQEVINEVADTLRPMADERGLSFEVDAPATPVVAHLDRRTLSQILLNLANNSIKFTERGGVTIELRQHERDRLVHTEIEVRDTGIGIRPEDQAGLFQAFSQLDAGSTRRFEGTGLGLYLSQRLAELIDGHLSCQSDYGIGARFTLALRGPHRLLEVAS